MTATEGRKRLTGDWTSTFFSKFTQLWPTCGLVFKHQHFKAPRNMLLGLPFWTAYARCKVTGCVAVKFDMVAADDVDGDFSVVCSVTGQCSHASQPQGSSHWCFVVM